MKQNYSYEEVFKSKRWSLGGAKPATLTLTLITSTTDIMPPISASDVTASAQVAQLCQSHLQVLINNKLLVCRLRDGFESLNLPPFVQSSQLTGTGIRSYRQ